MQFRKIEEDEGDRPIAAFNILLRESGRSFTALMRQ
jgi:hypothetical protein